MDFSEIHSHQSEENVSQSSEIDIERALESYNYSYKYRFFLEIHVVNTDMVNSQ